MNKENIAAKYVHNAPIKIHMDVDTELTDNGVKSKFMNNGVLYAEVFCHSIEEVGKWFTELIYSHGHELYYVVEKDNEH